MTGLTVATYNVHHSRSDDAIRKDVLTLTRQADVVALQECNGHQVAHIAGWGIHSGEPSTPILYRHATCTLAGKGVRPVTDPTPAGHAGRGPDKVAAKKVAWVKLGVGGHQVAVLNGHAVASITLKDRTPLFKQFIRVLADTVRRRHAAGQLVLVAGDFNATPNVRMLRPLWDVGLDISGNQAGTHGRRRIDYVMWHKGPAVRFVSERRVRLGSDHMAVLVELELAVKR